MRIAIVAVAGLIALLMLVFRAPTAWGRAGFIAALTTTLVIIGAALIYVS